jgi:PAS domain S-box-containing protein
VVASSPAVLFTLAIAGDQIQGITWISDNLLAILGHAPEAALSPDWWRGNIHPEDRDRITGEAYAELLILGCANHEYRFRHGDGSYRWTRGEMRLIRDGTGQAVEVVGSWSNVTERKHLEDQFRQAQKMEAVGRLAGGVAHDFNNLLTIINGYGELVLKGLLPDEPARALIREMVAAGDRAAALTRQLLAFSRKAILEPKVLDLKAVVADVDRMLRRILGEDIQLAVVMAPELGAVKADAGQIEQVILNLVINARDAMPQGGKLTIELHNADLDEAYALGHPEARVGPHVLLAVSDTGCGMDQTTLARLFEPFFTTKGERGNGLGLATVHGIIKQSGGHVAVYSEVGHGTTFKVYLPRLELRPGPSKSHHHQAVMPRSSETVLLVEDEHGARALCRHVLQGCGYALLEASDGVEAVRVAGQHGGRIDLLLTDVVMPRMSGREVAERLAGTHAGMKVLFLSGYTEDAVVRHGILEAEVAFLQKPFSPASLAAKVREVLDGA